MDKYNRIEKKIIKINYTYKSAIDKYYELAEKYSGQLQQLYKDYTGCEEDLLMIMYYKTLLKVYNECLQMDDFRKFDDIVSSATIKVAEYLFSSTAMSISSSILSRYIKAVMSDIYDHPRMKNESIYSHPELMEDQTMEEKYIEQDITDKIIDIAIGDNTKLNERELIIMSEYCEGLTLKKIGELHNVTSNRVAQIKNKALRKIRTNLISMYSPVRDLYAPTPKKQVTTTAKNRIGTRQSEYQRTEIELHKYLRYLNDFNYKVDELSYEFENTMDDRYKPNKLADAIMMGRFCLINWDDNIKCLTMFYKHSYSIPGLKRFAILFNHFIKSHYNFNPKIWTLDEDERMDIEVSLFHAFYCAVEYGVANQSAFSGYSVFENIIGKYHYIDNNYLKINREFSQYQLVDIIVDAMRTYSIALEEFGEWFYNRYPLTNNVDVYLWCKHNEYWDRNFGRYKKIAYLTVDRGYKIPNSTGSFYTTYSEMLDALTKSITLTSILSISDCLTKNYIMSQKDIDNFIVNK